MSDFVWVPDYSQNHDTGSEELSVAIDNILCAIMPVFQPALLEYPTIRRYIAIKTLELILPGIRGEYSRPEFQADLKAILQREKSINAVVRSPRLKCSDYMVVSSKPWDQYMHTDAPDCKVPSRLRLLTRFKKYFHRCNDYESLVLCLDKREGCHYSMLTFMEKYPNISTRNAIP